MNIHFIASRSVDAQAAFLKLRDLYGQCELEEANVIVVIGGDGMMLDTLHMYARSGYPIYGLNLGTVGYLMNSYRENDGCLYDRIRAAVISEICPLRISMEGYNDVFAWNEVTLMRSSTQAAKLRVIVNGVTRIRDMSCDGLICATPMGSTAYNKAAGGPVQPLEANTLLLTPLAPFRPRGWPGAVLTNKVEVRVEVLEKAKRPVSVTMDAHEYHDIEAIDVVTDHENPVSLLFDEGHSLQERIIREQFTF